MKKIINEYLIRIIVTFIYIISILCVLIGKLINIFEYWWQFFLICILLCVGYIMHITLAYFIDWSKMNK